LFIGSCSGNFYSLDKNTGEIRWIYNVRQDGDQRSFHGDPLVTSRLIIIGTDIGKQGHIYAFDRFTGKVQWKYLVTSCSKGDFGVSTNVIRRGSRLYAVAQGDDLLCLDLASGALVWHFTSRFDRTKFEWANAPVLLGNRVFFAGHDGTLYACDADSGKLLWKTDVGEPLTTSPVIVGHTLYVGASGRLYQLRVKDGAITSSANLPGQPWRNASIRRGHFFAIDDLGRNKPEELISLNLGSGRIQWSVEPRISASTPHPGWGTAWPYIWHNEVLASDNGHLYAYRESDGSLAWSHNFPGQTVRGIGITRDVLYLGTMHGMIYAFRPPQ
jgi:outer membrane protein assembly factor BamB